MSHRASSDKIGFRQTFPQWPVSATSIPRLLRTPRPSPLAISPDGGRPGDLRWHATSFTAQPSPAQPTQTGVHMEQPPAGNRSQSSGAPSNRSHSKALKNNDSYGPTATSQGRYNSERPSAAGRRHDFRPPPQTKRPSAIAVPGAH